MSDSLDGEIEGWYGTYVRVHSHICIPCSRMRRSLERTLALLKAMRPEDPPSQVDPER